MISKCIRRNKPVVARVVVAAFLFHYKVRGWVVASAVVIGLFFPSLKRFVGE